MEKCNTTGNTEVKPRDDMILAERGKDIGSICVIPWSTVGSVSHLHGCTESEEQMGWTASFDPFLEL